jgi:hypothetical protein
MPGQPQQQTAPNDSPGLAQPQQQEYPTQGQQTVPPASDRPQQQPQPQQPPEPQPTSTPDPAQEQTGLMQVQQRPPSNEPQEQTAQPAQQQQPPELAQAQAQQMTVAFQLPPAPANAKLTPYPQPLDFSNAAAQLNYAQLGLSLLQWEDLGTSIPSQVTSGEPADQTVAQAYTLTQVHPKYYFNLSTGLVVSSIHSRTFGWETNAPGFYSPIQTASNPIVDPALFLTVYWPGLPMDAESPWSKKNTIPAPTIGMSFTSPTSNFYIGLSSEVRRNIQIVFGASTAEPQRLSSTSVSATNTGTPPTSQKFTMGGFVGFSLNISGFIQTVLGGK